MKYYIVAGERSGDLHGGNLIREIRQLDSEAQIRCWGGDSMEEAGGILVKHYRDLAFMGFWEVLKNLHTIRGFLKFCQADILKYKPDAVILIDYAGFNLRIARFAKEQEFRVYYYIAPKTWAWNASRTHKLRKYTDRVFSILSFEPDFFKKYGVNATYVGNPLKDAIRNFEPDPSFREKHQLGCEPIIALLPGSRKQEIQNVLNTLLEAVPHFPQTHFVVAAVGNLPSSFYDPVRSHPQISIVTDETYQVLREAHLAIVTSGTATLETALFNVPQVVVYRTSTVSYRIARALIRVRYISLVNLIMDSEVVPELIQQDFTVENIVSWSKKLLVETEERESQFQAYTELQAVVGDRPTSRIVAEQIRADLT
ncbi:lipid-A-disaccharide synthase [Tunicatimonas pelagia]|uniref:lipid-A-disaccharide synthase n=1 Tax=Tunicatimonas pelagia TaxID=931531 RepID=UPI0026656F2A|nr:lipid-A-disaccharide synthase [Tunicatimonas pelagia]WKN43217.1 lipid-A-disaccharide synthase [Tunicatimonas pelagia]